MNLPISIIRSKRRSIGIQVERDGRVTVRAPLRAPQTTIDRFVAENRDWISKNLKKVQARQPIERVFEEGESFLYLGNEYPLRLVSGGRAALSLGDEFCLRTRDHKRAQDHFTRWYKTRARILFHERTRALASQMCVEHGRIRLSSAKYTWGSCSPTNNLSFTWRLAMAPMEIIDYIVVHELSHTKHKNHGKRFWRCVESHAPNYREHRKWLNDNSHLLHL